MSRPPVAKDHRSDAVRASVTRRAMRLLAAGVLTAGAFGAAACGDDDEDEPAAAGSGSPVTDGSDDGADDQAAAPAVFEVSVPGGADGEFAFAADVTTVEAGPVEVRLTNGGAVEHQASIFRFQDGETIDSFFATAATEGPTAALASIDGFGGPNAVAPGATGSSTQVLAPGEYALVCVIPDANGVPHAAMGMVSPFTVTGPAAGSDQLAAELPEPDVEVDLIDLAFVTPTELTAGDTVLATNRGEQVHEIVTYRLEDGQTVDDIVTAGAAGAPPPLVPAGGLALVAPGGASQFRLPEEPGDYVFLCFVPDATTEGGPPHLARGMAAQIRVD